MKKRTKQLLIAAAAAVAGSLTAIKLFRSSADTLMTLALDREEPKRMAKEKVKIMNSDTMNTIFETINQNSLALQSREHKIMEITSHDGLRLVGHWFETPNAKRVLIAMHGWRSSWSRDFGSIIDFWLNNGCSVLLPEQRAQGESDGEYMGFGVLERHDCLAWIQAVCETIQSDVPVYLCGISMGATTVLMTSGFELPANVHGIIADCGFTSPNDIWKHVVQNNLHLPYGLYRTIANDISRKKWNTETDYSCLQALSNCQVPVLFIHGTDDHFVPVTMTYDNYKACRSPKRLLVVPGAEHGLSYIVDKEAYEQATLTFWRDYDHAIFPLT